MNYVAVLILLTTMQAPTTHIRATNKDAQKFFDDYNAEYFEGKLSKTQVRFVHDLHYQGDRLEGLTNFGTPNVMYLDDEFEDDKDVWGEVILHESCHIALNDKGIVEYESHGPKWRGCMTRLALQGAFSGLW